MTLLAQRGGGNMSDKIYNATVKQVIRKFGRKIVISVRGIGVAYIARSKVPKGVLFPVGAKLQVKMSKHVDGRWIVSEIISIDGKAPAPQQSNNQQNQVKNQESPNNQPRKKNIAQRAVSGAKKAGSKLKEKVSRLFTGSEGYMRKMYLYAMGGSDADFGVLESRAESLGPFIEYVELAKKSNEHLKKRSKFIWEVVENQKRLEITERLGVDIRVRRTICLTSLGTMIWFQLRNGSTILHPKTKQVAKILRGIQMMELNSYRLRFETR